MKRTISILLATLMLLTSLCVVASAANFVPSIGYKPAPNPTDDKNGAIIVTSVEEAATTTKIPRAVADDLIAKYNIIAADDFKLSEWNEDLNKAVAEVLGAQYNANSLVIREFFNVYCTLEELNDYIAVDGQTVNLEFELDLGGKPAFILLEYDNQWHFVKVTDNGDGTVQALLNLRANAAGKSIDIDFEEFGHVAILVPVDGYEDIPQTGDAKDNALWIFVMFTALAGIFVLAFYNRKNFKLQKSN